MLTQVDGVPAYLPNCLLLQDTVNRAKEWLQEAEDLQVEYSTLYKLWSMYAFFKLVYRLMFMFLKLYLSAVLIAVYVIVCVSVFAGRLEVRLWFSARSLIWFWELMLFLCDWSLWTSWRFWYQRCRPGKSRLLKPSSSKTLISCCWRLDWSYHIKLMRNNLLKYLGF